MKQLSTVFEKNKTSFDTKYKIKQTYSLHITTKCAILFMEILHMERRERFMQEKINLAVIGGGASGLIAAITASKICKQTKKITIFEGASRVGKKLLATGNGRCNLTNIHASAKHYYGDTRLIEAILRTYPPQRVIQYFEEIGLLCKEESEGRIYPYSLQATALEDASALNVEKLVDPKPAELSKYGLDNPEMEVVLKDRNTELTVKVGSQVQDDSDIDYRYVQINNRSEVFTMDQRALQSFFDADIVDFVQPFVSLHSRSSVNKIEAENNDKKFNVEFKSEGENTFVKTKEGIEKDNRNAYVSGKLVKRELFTPFYQNIVGLSFDSILKENANVSGTPQTVITYVMKDGSKEKIEFYNYDDNYYVAKKGESSTLVVNKQSVRKLFLDAEKVLNGESVENSDSEKGQSS